MNRIIINGDSFECDGNNISISNNTIKVNGKIITKDLSGIVEVVFEGDLASLKCNAAVTVKGNVKGNVDAGNSVNCGDIIGNVDADNSVNCGIVTGNVDAGNSIINRR